MTGVRPEPLSRAGARKHKVFEQNPSKPGNREYAIEPDHITASMAWTFFTGNWVARSSRSPLFAGSDGASDHWAVLASPIETCKLAGVEPRADLADVLTRIVGDHPDSRIDERLPWAYATPAPIAAVA